MAVDRANHRRDARDIDGMRATRHASAAARVTMAGVTTRPDATHRRDPGEPVSYWLRGPAPAMDPPLEAGEALDVDVAIVGGGFTGLWTAIALTDTDPRSGWPCSRRRPSPSAPAAATAASARRA